MADKFKKYVFILPALLLLGYSVFRAVHLSITIDEGFSFIFYVLDSYRNIISFRLVDPNNHVLNTVLMKFFSSWLPLSEWVLRIPALFGHVLFLWFTWQMVKDLKNIWFSISAFLFLNMNPFMLDFFSLARGYALSWGLLAGCLYYLKKLLETNRKIFLNTTLCFVFAAFSVLASFPVLNFYLALCCVLFVILLYKIVIKKEGVPYLKRQRKSIVFLAVISIILLSYSFWITIKLYHSGFLYFGGINGFWMDTVGSLADSYVFNAVYAIKMRMALKLFAILIPVMSAGLLGYRLFYEKKAPDNFSFFIVLLLLLLFICFGIVFQHMLFGTRFVIERAAVFILIVFQFCFVWFLHGLFPARIRNTAIIIVSILSVAHFVNVANVSYAFEWKSDASSKTMMQDLGKVHQQQKEVSAKTVVLQPDWLFVTSTMFYRYLYHYDWMEPIESKKVYTLAEDYYYVPENSMNQLKDHPVEILKRYPLTHSVLLRNTAKKREIIFDQKKAELYDTVQKKQSLQQFMSLQTYENINCIELNNNIFSPELNFNLNKTMIKGPLTITAKALCFFPDGKCGDFVIKVADKHGKTIKWDALGFDRYLLQKDGWMEVPFKIVLNQIDPEACRITVFIWNTGNKNILVSNIEAEITGF